MFNVNGTARIARVGEFKTNTEGKKSINLTLVDRRNYVSTVDGEKKSDFIFCKAYGNTADFIHKYCSEKDDKGKIISRIIEFLGTMETYQGTDIIDVEENKALPFHPDKVAKYGISEADVFTTYKLKNKVQHETTKTVVVLNTIKLWDSKVPEAVKTAPKKEEGTNYEFADEVSGSTTTATKGPAKVNTTKATSAEDAMADIVNKAKALSDTDMSTINIGTLGEGETGNVPF
jgi:hypothetical protein